MKAVNLKFQSHKSLSIVQFETGEKNSFDYISLSDAIMKKYITVKEISESGSVNDLKVVNESPFFVFMSDGDILAGAKQNRVLNSSVLIAPGKTIIIPVSCIEQGRWKYKTREFSSSDYSTPSFMRYKKASNVKRNLNVNSRHETSQSEIWKSVMFYEENYKSGSSTSNLSDVFDCRKEDLENSAKSFEIESGSNGIAIFLNKRLVNIEVFNKDVIYNEYFPKLIKGVYFEANLQTKQKNDLNEDDAFTKVKEFFDGLTYMKFDEHKGVGAGIEKRFDTAEMTGFELNYENYSVHIAALGSQE